VVRAFSHTRRSMPAADASAPTRFGRDLNLLAEQFSDKENQNSPAQPTAKQQIKECVASGGKHRNKQHHNFLFLYYVQTDFLFDPTPNCTLGAIRAIGCFSSALPFRRESKRGLTVRGYREELLLRTASEGRRCAPRKPFRIARFNVRIVRDRNGWKLRVRQ
jgi:hypothetical protein